MAIDREKVVQLAESGAGVVALHPFTPYEWFAPFDEALQEILARHGYDNRPHPEEVDRIMEGKGYARDEGGILGRPRRGSVSRSPSTCPSGCGPTVRP